MVGRLFQRAGEAEDLVGAFARRCLHGDEPRATHGEGTGLIEHHGVRARQCLQGAPAFDQNAAARRL